MANGLSTEEIAKFIGADMLFYQEEKELLASAKKGNPEVKDFCYACMGGKYPTNDITEEMLTENERDRGSAQEPDEYGSEGDDKNKEDQMSFM